MSAAIESPRLYPTMRCKDAESMIRWLKDVLGFTEYAVYRDNGVIQHAELAYGSSLLMLGQVRDDDYSKMVGDPGGRRTDAIYLAVDGIDALYVKVKASGVRIESEPHDTHYGSRDFSCRDPDGNLWSFGTYWPKAHEKPMAAAE